MDQDIRRRQGDDFAAILNTLKEWVADPLVRELGTIRDEMRADQARTAEQFRAMRDDLREQLTASREDFRATLAAMTNPDTGYVPRSEINQLFEANRSAIEKLQFENTERERERRANARWMVGIAITASAGLAGAISTIAAVFIHH